LRLKMLKQRLITAAILAPLALLGVFGLPFSGFVYLMDAVILVAAWEWANLSGYQATKERWTYVLVAGVLVAIAHYYQPSISSDLVLQLAVLFWCLALYAVMRYPVIPGWGSRFARALIGFVVLLPCWFAFVSMKAADDGDLLILLLFLLVWGADVGAYFAGKRFGRTKLAADVSPGKTREGLYGGLLACLLIAVSYALILGYELPQLILLMVLAFITGLISVLGDLFESMLKRHRGIKDSSQLLPGHGGVLDRIDSLTAAAPLFVLGMQFLVLT
jgi:phosphatidate cytidylyltransferase